MTFAPFNFFEQWIAVLPELLLTVLIAVIVFVVDWRRKEQPAAPYATALGLFAIGLVALFVQVPAGPNAALGQPYMYFGGMIRADVMAQVFRALAMFAGGITALMSLDARGIGMKGEFYVVLMVSTLGASLLGASADLIMAFVALETMSISLYILAGFKRTDSRSTESSMKYFLFGSFASAFMLYGFSLLYGFTGQTNLYAIAGVLSAPAFAVGPNLIPLLMAIVLILIGFGFKISAAPFHFWTPDVYEGAPSPISGFLSVASKAASFALIVRFFSASLPETVMIGGQSIEQFWVLSLSGVAVISMIVGNVIALVQTSIKRMLAYSSIAQAGYALVGVVALQSASVEGQSAAVASVGFYMFMYMFTNLLAFAVVVYFSEVTGSEKISDFAGLSRRSPMLALTLTVALLSLAGVPPAAGFVGKFYLFTAAVQADLTLLAMIGVLMSIVALYYYLVVIKVMYVDRHPDEDKPLPLSTASGWVLGITTIAVLLLGTVFAGPLYEMMVNGSHSMFEGVAQIAAMLPK
jgi:NADH-quinone oxidoreductase subunit N